MDQQVFGVLIPASTTKTSTATDVEERLETDTAGTVVAPEIVPVSTKYESPSVSCEVEI